MRVSEAMAAAGINASKDGGAPPEDWFYARCPGCRESFQLAALPQRDKGAQTQYVCPSCHTVIVTVGPALGLTGYRLKSNAIQAPGGMWMRHPNGNVVDFPATGGS